MSDPGFTGGEQHTGGRTGPMSEAERRYWEERAKKQRDDIKEYEDYGKTSQGWKEQHDWWSDWNKNNPADGVGPKPPVADVPIGAAPVGAPPTDPAPPPAPGELEGPGAGEQWWDEHKGWFDQPGQVNQWWDQNRDWYTQAGPTEQWWDQNMNRLNRESESERAMRRLPGPADFSGYYDHARTLTQGALNDQMAARGAYNSSAAMNSIGNAVADISAQEAGRRSDYDLSVAGLRNNLAGQIDSNALARMGLGLQGSGMVSDEQTKRMGMGAGLAQGVDANDLGRMMAGFGAAGGAQGMNEKRLGDMLDRMFQQSALLQSQAQASYNDMIGADQDLFDSLINAMLGLGAEDRNQGNREKEDHRADIGIIAELIGSIFGKGK